MTKQTKKLIAIFVVMAITMFAIIKANAEIRYEYSGISNMSDIYRSTEFEYAIIGVPRNDRCSVLTDDYWIDQLEIFASERNWSKKVESKKLNPRKLKEDTLKLLDISGYVYFIEFEKDGSKYTSVYKDHKNRIICYTTTWGKVEGIKL